MGEWFHAILSPKLRRIRKRKRLKRRRISIPSDFHLLNLVAYLFDFLT